MEHVVKINLPGGFISAGDLYEILLIAEGAGAINIRFGNRQQLYLTFNSYDAEYLEMEMLRAGIEYEVNTDNYPNIVSSYMCDAIFSHDSWLKEGVYRDIFDLFNHQPRLKINLADQNQTFVPFFSGNFNFISSEINNYWYLYIRFPKTNQLYCWPSLVYSDDIAILSKVAEDVIFKQKEYFFDQPKINEAFFYKTVTSKLHTSVNHQAVPLKLPEFFLPYYEGFNKYANGKYWLGVYRRNELFPLEFLKDMCKLCLKTRVGQVYTTPWKSLLIKGINEPDRNEWGNILNKYRLNVRHAANELNWQLENLCNEGLNLKKQLVYEFEEYDLRTYRLCFAIKIQPKSGLLASIIIKKQRADFFDILYTKDFNPNSKDFVVYKTEVYKDKLSNYLIELCDLYYGSLTNKNASAGPEAAEAKDHDNADETQLVYQCKKCLSIYDKAYGDEVNGIVPGIDFETITDYLCPVCESSKLSFRKVEKKPSGYQVS